MKAARGKAPTACGGSTRCRGTPRNTKRPSETEATATATTITKPGAFTLDRFKTKRAAAIANVETLLTALPHYSIAQAKDFVRLHPNEDEYWSPEL